MDLVSIMIMVSDFKELGSKPSQDTLFCGHGPDRVWNLGHGTAEAPGE